MLKKHPATRTTSGLARTGRQPRCETPRQEALRTDLASCALRVEKATEGCTER